MAEADNPGKIITFYSYKGGTGRSMTLANVAWVLASNGRRVLAVDWDLEAPGLHRYFYPFLMDKDLTSSDGIIDLVIDFEFEALRHPEAGVPDPDWYKPHADILRYASSLDWDFPGDGTLDFIPAGRQGDSYTARVTTFNWQNFYDKLGGGVFLEAVKERMREEYDYILIDSRTGVSDSSGICSVQMPDALVVCFTLNHQSIEGSAAVATSVYEQRRKADPAVKVFPVPMRVENGEKEKLELRREYAKRYFDRFPAHVPHDKRGDYWGDVEVIYVPYYAYEEILAPFGDKRGQTVSLLASVERLTAYLTQGDPLGEVKRLVAPPDEERRRVLAEYARKSVDADLAEVRPRDEDEEQINAAEYVYASFTPEQQAVARRVLTRLVRVSPPEEVAADTRLRVKRADLGVAAEPVLDELIYKQLVLLGYDEETQENTVELAGDALVQKWKRMRGWVAEDHEFLLWRQALQLGISKWESTGGDSGALLQGAFLAEAEGYRQKRADALTDNECAFIEESVRAESARQEAENELRRKEEQARFETAQVLREKRQLWIKLAAALVTMSLLTAGAYQLIFYRERTLAFLGVSPMPYTGFWDEDFKITPDGKPDATRWDYPPQDQWTIVKGEGIAGDDGALLISGPAVGVAKLDPPNLYNFTANFKVGIVRGAKAAWMFRVQPDKRNGYVFVLERDTENSTLVINGYVQHGDGTSEPLDESGHKVPFRDCCKDSDKFRIRAKVEGNEFKYWVTVESDFDPEKVKADFDPAKRERRDTGVEYFIEPFRDNRSLFPYGMVGLLGPDNDGQVVVELIDISSGPAASQTPVPEEQE